MLMKMTFSMHVHIICACTHYLCMYTSECPFVVHSSVHEMVCSELRPVYSETFQRGDVFFEQISLLFLVCLHENVSVFTWK